LVALDAKQGKMTSAMRQLEQIESQNDVNANDVYLARFLEIFIQRLANRIDAPPPVLCDSTVEGLVFGAMQADASQKTEMVGDFLRQLERKSACEKRWIGRDLRYLKASIAASSGDWQSSIQLTELEEDLASLIGNAPSRWFVAHAYERLGNLEAAINTYERILELKGCDTNDRFFLRPILMPHVHRKLGLLYARLGRAEEAHRHWQLFTELFSDLDPDLAPMLIEPRPALASRKTR
jgi:tetratricopeptide (TPR) repeat protein